MSNDSQEQIKVIDRRRFNTEGEGGEDAEQKSDSNLKNKEEKDLNQAQNLGQDLSSKKGGKEQEKPKSLEVDFSSFVVSLATQALVLMGEIPHPESGKTMDSLDDARQTIDILALLETKTKGNLTEHEERLIGEVLTSLRLAYVGKIDASKTGK